MMAMDDWNEDTDGHGVKDQMDSDDAGDGIHDGKEDEDGWQIRMMPMMMVMG